MTIAQSSVNIEHIYATFLKLEQNELLEYDIKKYFLVPPGPLVPPLWVDL